MSLGSERGHKLLLHRQGHVYEFLDHGEGSVACVYEAYIDGELLCQGDQLLGCGVEVMLGERLRGDYDDVVQ